MQTLSCPIPNNINSLQSNGFQFTINKLPDVHYFCQEVTLPTISLPTADAESPLSRVPFAGDKLQFDQLQISFIINEDMSNYKAIYDWLVGMGFPELHEQYKKFLSDNINSLVTTPAMASYSDAVLTILNSANNAIRTVNFVDLLPVSLGSITFQSTTDNTVYLIGTASFDYNYYYFM